MKIITGIGRSGTSALMQYAIACKMNTGKTKFIKQYDAGHEHQEFMEINNHIFKNGLCVDSKKQIENFNLEIVKQPEFIRDTSILKAWWMVRKDIEIIYCERPFKDIQASQKRKPSMTCPTYRCFIDEMARVQSDFLNECVNLGIKVTRLQYPFTDYKQINRALGLNNNGEIFKRVIK